MLFVWSIHYSLYSIEWSDIKVSSMLYAYVGTYYLLYNITYQYTLSYSRYYINVITVCSAVHNCLVIEYILYLAIYVYQCIELPKADG